MDPETRRRIRLVDPLYTHDTWSAVQVWGLTFFVFLGAQALGLLLFSAELTQLQGWNAVIFSTVYVVVQRIRQPARIAWLRRKGRLTVVS